MAVNQQEYVIRCPKNEHKKYHMMLFNGSTDFSSWTNVKMERNSVSDTKSNETEDQQPKFGAGSEFGKEIRDEIRKKKYGGSKNKSSDQPWMLKVGSKKFRGLREGGVSENAAYYVFAHGADNVIEAYPLEEWYKFQAISRFKTLTAEEAEVEFTKRNKHINYFSLMLRKRLKNDEVADVDLDGLNSLSISKMSKSAKNQDLKISEMDEWISSDDDGSIDSDDAPKVKSKNDDEDDGNQTKKTKKKKIVKKKKERDSNSEAFEDSDDGDDEGREMDYISDSTNSEDEMPIEKQLQGVNDEKGLRKLLTSDEDSEDEDENPNKTKNEDKDNENPETSKKDIDTKKDEPKSMSSLIEDEKTPDKSSISKIQHHTTSVDDRLKKLKKKKKKHHHHHHHGHHSNHHSSKKHESSGKKEKEREKDSNSSDENIIDDSSDDNMEQNKNNKGSEFSSGLTGNGSGIANAGDSSKRKMLSESGNSLKRMKLDLSTGCLSSISSDTGINEFTVRRYLMRKPMTTTELLQKFKSKKTGLSSDQLVNTLTQILKKINPVKQTIKGKMYLSIKS